jgi:hypothetical protein
MAEQDKQAVNFADDLSQSSAGSGSLSASTSNMDSTTTSVTKKDGTTPLEQMQALAKSRIVVSVSLIILIIVAGITTFFMTSNTQEEYLDSQVSDYELAVILSCQQLF